MTADVTAPRLLRAGRSGPAIGCRAGDQRATPRWKANRPYRPKQHAVVGTGAHHQDHAAEVPDREQHRIELWRRGGAPRGSASPPAISAVASRRLVPRGASLRAWRLALHTLREWSTTKNVHAKHSRTGRRVTLTRRHLVRIGVPRREEAAWRVGLPAAAEEAQAVGPVEEGEEGGDEGGDVGHGGGAQDLACSQELLAGDVAAALEGGESASAGVEFDG